jgi:hypothetical protein
MTWRATTSGGSRTRRNWPNWKSTIFGCPRCAEPVAEIEDEVDAIQVALLRAADAHGEMLDPGQRRRRS